MFLRSLKDHEELLGLVRDKLSPHINQICMVLADTFLQGKKLLIVGNGGSAADAQHIASEFTGRFYRERKALPAIALTTDSSALTAIANDYGYENVFARQIAAIADKNDVLLAISTSGNSLSVINAIKTANKLGVKCIGLSGNDGGHMRDLCQINLIVPSNITARVQEIHILIGHILCEYIDLIHMDSDEPSTKESLKPETT